MVFVIWLSKRSSLQASLCLCVRSSLSSFLSLSSLSFYCTGKQGEQTSGQLCPSLFEITKQKINKISQWSFFFFFFLDSKLPSSKIKPLPSFCLYFPLGPDSEGRMILFKSILYALLFIFLFNLKLLGYRLRRTGFYFLSDRTTTLNSPVPQFPYLMGSNRSFN